MQGPRPKRLPLAGYKDIFYKDPGATLGVDPPAISPQCESNVGSAPKTITIEYKAFLAMERRQRRLVATISSVDILMAALRTQASKMADLPDAEKKSALAVNAQLTNSLTMAISHAMSFAVRSVADSVTLRRKATLAVAKKVDSWWGRL